MSKLIILRGPSGAGKSTVAMMLKEGATNKLALFEQDYYRHRLLNHPERDHEVARHIMFAGMAKTLELGVDVVAEGMLNRTKYEPYFDELFNAHPEDNHFFYFDVSPEESVRRHATRAKADDFTAEEMLSWYGRATPYGHQDEHIIPEAFTAEQAYRHVIAVSGLAIVVNTDKS